MYLKRLELHGFKSFAAATALEFQRGVSAVVGPNGSGKSNIADALRFVLGEQSMKTIRSKKGEDLIFSGSPTKQRMGMATVALHFDNSDRAFPVEFETVVFRRKIFRDGENQYMVNEAQVRLKDVQELIAKAKLGLKGYTIINQGMGDAILDASPEDRKDIIYEALGLREFQLKKADALLKLSHTEINLEKAEGIMREIEPHLKFLKRQAEKMEERHEIETKLKKLESAFMAKRLVVLEEKLGKLLKKASADEAHIEDLRLGVETAEREMEKLERHMGEVFGGSAKLENTLAEEELQRNAVEREIGKVEGMLASLSLRGDISASSLDVFAVRKKMGAILDELTLALREEHIVDMRARVENATKDCAELVEGLTSGKERKGSPKEGESDLERQKKHLSELLLASDKKIKEVKEEIKRIRGTHTKEQERVFALRNERREHELALLHAEEKFREVRGEIERLRTEKDILAKEAEFLKSSGGAFLAGTEELPLSQSDEETRRDIERFKIKLENIDLIDQGVSKEYQETRERHAFLAKESEDLRQAISSLHKVIAELDEMIANRFKEAFKKINGNFDTYFKMLFGGGSASIRVVEPETEAESEEETGEEKKSDFGVEIAVSLPRKKAAGLSVLSGGERALTSIALLFALVSTSPPPFLVLDEIDAPLDEANSVRFGKILGELKHHTQFVIITHNRETMRQADVLWGVTMQEDGVSKLLSLKFEAAKEMAR